MYWTASNASGVPLCESHAIGMQWCATNGGTSEVEGLVTCSTLGRSQDVCKGARFSVEGELCVVSS